MKKYRINYSVTLGDPTYKLEVRKWWGWEYIALAFTEDKANELLNHLNKNNSNEPIRD